jgi:multiple sugar transport system substrate-binding protein
LDPWSYKGQQWAAPLSYYFKFYYYNQQALEKGGISAPPTTYEELVEVSQHLMDEGIVKHGQSWGWTQAEGLICDWQQLMQAFGGDWWDASGNWSFNQEPAVAALQYMVDNLKSKVFDPASPTLNDRTTMNVFARGDTAFMTNWGFAWSAVNDPTQSQVSGQVKLTINPGTKVANVVSTSCGGGGGFGVTANAKNKDAAWDAVGLLTSLTKPENDAAKLKMIGAPPVHQAAWQDPAILAENPHFAEMIKQAPYMRHRPTIPWYTEFSKIVQIELTKALAGSSSPKQALDDAVSAVKSKGNPPVA